VSLPILPAVVVDAPAPTSAPLEPGEPPFVFIAIPGRWTVLDGLVCPALQQQRCVPGANGVGWDWRHKRLDLRELEADCRRTGRILLGWETTEDGQPYVVPHESGRGWRSRWERPGRPDRAAYARWCRWLVDTGRVPDITPVDLDRLIERAEEQVARYLDVPRNVYNMRAKRIQADLDALLAYRERMASQPEPSAAPSAAPAVPPLPAVVTEPKPVRRPRKAATAVVESGGDEPQAA
jgi:hypothetical protein